MRWWAALWVVLSASPVAAQPAAENRAAAQALFETAGRLYREGKYSEACAKLADSSRLDPAAGTLLNLARCYEKVGRTASAWLAYLDAAGLAKKGGQDERERTARAAAGKLAPELPRLVIEVPSALAAATLEIRRDGEVVPRSAWNLDAPVDPGEHQIEASAPGKTKWSQRVRAEAAKSVTVSIPPLADAPLAAGTASTASTGGTAGAADEPTSRDGRARDSGATRRIIALAVGGAGLVGIGVGTVFGLSAKSERDAANGICPTDSCNDPGALEHNSNSHSRATAATVAFALGGASIAAGAVLWLTAPANPSRPPQGGASLPRVAVVPALAGDRPIMIVRGEW